MLPHLLERMFKHGTLRTTRNGPVLRFEGPVLLAFERPTERVLFWPERDANPFFHLLESVWMLAGRDDVAYVKRFSSRIGNYSDNGVTFHGAYGYRWRHWFGRDQLDIIAAQLKVEPLCRRQVLQMWDPASDLRRFYPERKDLPCNTHAYFSLDSGRLDITVCNRSNDLVWGCLGANAVQFSMLQEYMASRMEVPVGTYYQFTNNLHGYLDTIEPLRALVNRAGEPSPYGLGEVQPYGLDIGTGVCFHEDLEYLGDPSRYQSTFFVNVVGPAETAWEAYKSSNLERALGLVQDVEAADWRIAMEQWLQRRVERRRKAGDDGVNHEPSPKEARHGCGMTAVNS
jgi:hypothetical protein